MERTTPAGNCMTHGGCVISVYPQVEDIFLLHEGPARTAGEYKAGFEADPARFDFDPFMEFLYQWLN